MNKIILSADSTCDLGDSLKERYEVNYCPMHIILGDHDYLDGIDITPDDIYATYQEKHILPKTAAINPADYINHFKRWTDEGYAVIHQGCRLPTRIAGWRHRNSKMFILSTPVISQPVWDFL